MPAELGDAAASAPAPAPAAGGAAILARLRAQRAAAANAPAAAASTAAAPPTRPAAPADAAVQSAAPAPTAAAAAAPPVKPAAAVPPAADGPAPATGGAAILARLRAQRGAAQARAAAAKQAPAKEVIVLYASQTGTAQEIAKNIQAEAEQRGIKGRVASMNEFGFESLTAQQAPVVVYVASSTGDGDAPDNAAKFFATLRRKSQPAGLLQGIAFTGFGLGDSNYTRYQYVPRAIRQRFQDLGAEVFYPPGEADEVDGIEEGLDKWLEGLWPALKKAVAPEGAAAAPAADSAAAAQGGDGELKGVPPLPRCRVRLVWREGGGAGGGPPASEAAAAGGSGEAVRPELAYRTPSAAELAYRDPEGHYSAEQPFWAPVTAARWLTAPASAADRQVLHLELDISGSGMAYAPGDAIGVLPQNDARLVSALLARLGLDGEAVFDVAPAEEEGEGEAAAAAAAGGSAGGSQPPQQQQPQQQQQQQQRHPEHLLPHLRAPCSVRAALTSGVDLTGPPRKSLLRLLAEHCGDPADRRRLLHLCSREGREAYAAELAARPSLPDLLEAHPSCAPPLGALLDALPPLAARMYSLTCSPLEQPDRVQAAFTVVRYRSERYGEREGVATSWLHSLLAPLADGGGGGGGDGGGLRLPVFLRRGGAFGPPASLDVPLIMVGPGTGVAPFRGFLQHRRAQLAAAAGGGGGGAAGKGAAWLFFGCRRRDQDYLYGEELEGFVADGTLDRLEVAFSRAQAHKVYVQHLMQQHAAELYALIAKHGARVYVCGDGANMAKDVHACLAAILREQGGLSEAEAAEQLAEMTRAGRYVRDIWS